MYLITRGSGTSDATDRPRQRSMADIGSRVCVIIEVQVHVSVNGTCASVPVRHAWDHVFCRRQIR